VRRREDGIHFTAKGQIGLRLSTGIPLETEHGAALADVTLIASRIARSIAIQYIKLGDGNSPRCRRQ
jgi:hypothetical protein